MFKVDLLGEHLVAFSGSNVTYTASHTIIAFQLPRTLFVLMMSSFCKSTPTLVEKMTASVLKFHNLISFLSMLLDCLPLIHASKGKTIFSINVINTYEHLNNLVNM